MFSGFVPIACCSVVDRLENAIKVPVHLPPANRVMAFDGKGNCVSGC